MSSRLPTAALLLGLAGLIPFLGCAYLAVGTADAVLADRALHALIAYGAVILAFLGGVHWGFVLAPPGFDRPLDNRQATRRLVLGVVPSLFGWLALLTFGVLPAPVALAILIAGFVGIVVVEARLVRQGVVPAAYMPLRYGLSAVVALCLATVLTLNVIGARIIF